MGRILSIDYGLKRTGLAVTDPLQIIANGLDTVQTESLFNYLKDYFASEPVEKVIVGYPKQMNNSPSESVPMIDKFLSRFRNVFPDIIVDTIDERFTSKMAARAIIDGGVKKSRRRDKGLIDKISAVLILQSYLEQKDNLKK